MTNRSQHIRNRINRLRRAQEDLAIEIAELEVDLDRAIADHVRYLAGRERQLVAAVDRTRNQSTIAEAAEFYGIGVDEVLGRGRDPRTVEARHAAMWLLRARGLTFTAIARIFDRDHSTVLYACEKIDRDPARRAVLWSLVDPDA